MSKQGKVIFGALVLIVVIAGLAYWFSLPKTAKPSGFSVAVVAGTEVKQENWLPSLQSVGSLVATNGINVSTEVSGIVSVIVFTSGQPVEKDQVLIRLDDSVDVAALEALRADSKLAQVQFNRIKGLIKKQVTSKADFDEAEARFDAAKARVKQQEAVIKRKVIRAPFSGLAGIRQVDLGQYLDTGNPIVSLQALDPIHVDYTLPERYLTQIKTDQVVRLTLDAIPDKVFTGKITAINSGIDTGTRTLRVRATLTNPDNILRPGMFAQVETITGEAGTVLTLPRTSISFNTYGNFVYVINKDDKGQLTVKRTPLESGEVRGGRVAVKGLQAGTQVVRAGLVKLRDGMPIKIDNSVILNDAEIKGE